MHSKYLTDEVVGMRRNAEAVQQAFDTIAQEKKVKVFTAGLCVVQKPLEVGVSHVCFW